MTGATELRAAHVSITQIASLVDDRLHLCAAVIRPPIHEAIGAISGIEPEAVHPDAGLFDDLGLDSLDLVDLAVRFQEAFGVDVHMAKIQTQIVDILSEGFDLGSPLPDGAIDVLRALMPELQQDRIPSECTLQDIPSLFTVETLVRLVAWHLVEADEQKAGGATTER